MKNFAILILIIVLGFGSIHLYNEYPSIWVLFAVVGFFIIMMSRRTFPVRSPWKPMSIKERLARDTTPPASVIKAIQERYALNKEVKIENPPPHRKREIAKRLIFLDGYLAAKQQGA